MKTPSASLEVFHDFLGQKGIALVGASRKPGELSTMVFNELCRRGYEVIPVNPNATEVLGRRCFAHVHEIQPPVEAALLMTPPEVTETVVRDCAEAGVHFIWMHRAGGTGAVSEKAVEFCQARGMRVIPGECPLMFLPESGGVHRFHGFLRKITGRYPKAADAISSEGAH